MVVVEHVFPATAGAPERVESEVQETAAKTSPPKLLKSLANVEKRAAGTRDKSGQRATYLVDSGLHLRALKCLEANLGRTEQADAAGKVYSHEVLESYLRCRFMVFDKTGKGQIDMADFSKLLGLLKDGLRDAGVLDDGPGAPFSDGGEGLPEDAADLDADVGSVLSANGRAALAKVPVLRLIRDEIAERGHGWQHWDHLARAFTAMRSPRGRWRRVDLLVAAHVEWPFALLSWTGGKMFNRMLRDFANKHRLSLSAHCLMTVPGDGSEARLVPAETHPDAPLPRTEEDVLRLLGIPWLPPHLRDV